MASVLSSKCVLGTLEDFTLSYKDTREALGCHWLEMYLAKCLQCILSSARSYLNIRLNPQPDGILGSSLPQRCVNTQRSAGGDSIPGDLESSLPAALNAPAVPRSVRDQDAEKSRMRVGELVISPYQYSSTSKEANSLLFYVLSWDGCLLNYKIETLL